MKPDWATRLQRTFARKYDAGFAKGLMFGKAVGARDERDRIVALLEEHYPQPNDHDFVGCDCEQAGHDWYNKHLIELIKGETK